MKYESVKELLPTNVRPDKPAFALSRPSDSLLLSANLKRFVRNAESAIIFNSFENALKFAAKLQEQIRHEQFLDDLQRSDENALIPESKFVPFRRISQKWGNKVNNKPKTYAKK